MKKFFLALLILIVSVAAAVWVFRYDILRFSANMALEKVIPGNVAVKKIVVDHSARKIEVHGLTMANPRGFSESIFAEMGVFTVKYRMRGKTILTGIEIAGFECLDLVVRIERLSNGRINSEEVDIVAPGGNSERLPEIEFRNSGGHAESGTGTAVAKSVSEAVDLSGRIPGEVINGKVFFTDNMVVKGPFFGSLEDINSDVGFVLSDDYEITYFDAEGQGFVNGDVSQRVKWNISSDLALEMVSMSNRIEPENVDIMIFKPYYDQFSPVNIKKGRVSGTVIFDLNGRNIGSDNTLRFKDLEFTERETTYASEFWDTSITDVVKYLELSSGETVFDFKIKGSIDNPRFYPGPNVSRAIRNMAVDKIGEMIKRSTEPDETADGTKGKSDVDRALEIFQELMKK